MSLRSIEPPKSSPWYYQASQPALADYASVSDVDCPPRADIEDRLKHVQRRFWASRQAALLLVFQGLDASGKDGCIRAVCAGMDPMGYDAVGSGVPSDVERSHDFLWRLQPHLPALGHVTLMNRSHYEAVLAERVLSDEQDAIAYDGTSRYRSIRDFERHLSDNGTCVLKFWLHVSQSEQAQRLKKRLTDPERHWKFHPSDLHSWQHRDKYLDYASEALQQTHCEQSPWHVIPADDKKLARKIVCTRVIEVMDALAGEYPSKDQQTLNRYLEALESGGGGL